MATDWLKMTSTDVMTEQRVILTTEFFDMGKHKWNRWIERLETTFEIYKVTDGKEKRNYLIQFMGVNTYDIICDMLEPQKPKDKTYDELKALAESHFCPKPLELVENFKFHLKYQKEGESLEDFLVGLKKQAATCNFGNYLNTALRNQFVFGLRNKSIQNRCLEKRELSLNQAIDIAKATELSEAGASFMKNNSEWTGAIAEVNYVRKKSDPGNRHTGSRQFLTCYRCGDNHYARECRYTNTVCSFCNIKGHLKKCCFKFKKQQSREDTNYVEGEENGEVNMVDILSLSEFRGHDWKVEVMLDSKLVKFVVDTGSRYSLMSLKDFKKLFPKKKLDTSECFGLRAYTGKIFKTLGFAMVNTQYRNKMQELKIFVSPVEKYPLLGRDWIQNLNIDLNRLRGISDVNSVESVFLTTLKSKFPLIFSKTPGKVLNFEAKINMMENARPIFIKHRPVPFAIREQVSEEINDLVQRGLLEKVESSEWGTPIVVIQKGNKKIRMCGDYRVTVNKSIKVDRHPMPTIEELFSTMSGGQKFSKIDLTSAYLQISVKEEHREYLTLSTHIGLYRPTRLQFGVSSAPAIFQRFMEQLLVDIEGVTVFLDDIKITGPNDEIHLERLHQVLDRLDKNNMRVNEDKCEFFKEEIEYCGYKINRDGVHKSKKKIDALENMATPKK